jgi:hypothetical protein
MHIENELAEIVTTGDQNYEEIIEEYEEEILIQEKVPELPLTDASTEVEWVGLVCAWGTNETCILGYLAGIH